MKIKNRATEVMFWPGMNNDIENIVRTCDVCHKRQRRETFIPFDISEIPDKRSTTVVLHTKRIFSRYGIPKEVISDNGPEFIGKAYKKFSKK